MSGSPHLWDTTADIPGTQTLEKVETSDRFQYFKPSVKCTNFQNGNSRIYQEVDSKAGVGHFDRPHRRLFTCYNSPSISKIYEISNKKRGSPISGTPFWCRNSSPRVNSHCERGKTHSSSQEPQNTSIAGRLASLVTHKEQCLIDSENLVKLVQELGWLINFQMSELVPTQKLGFLGYHFNLERDLVFPTQKKLDQLKVQTVSIRKLLVLTPIKLMSLIGTLASLEKTVPLGRLHMRPFQWYLKSLEISPVTGQKDPNNREFYEISQMVRESTESYGRCSYPSSCSQWYSQMPPKKGGELTYTR